MTQSAHATTTSGMARVASARPANQDWPPDRRKRVEQRAQELLMQVSEDRLVLSDLLQGFEHTVKEVRRLSRVLRAVLEAQQRGERLPDGIVADYIEQLTRVDADRERMEEQIAVLRAMVGRDQPH